MLRVGWQDKGLRKPQRWFAAAFDRSTTFRLIKKFQSNARGTIAIIAAAAIPVLFLVVGGALDFAMFLKQRSQFQAAADAAALAGAKGLSLSNAQTENVEAVVRAVAEKFIGENADAGTGSGVTINATVKNDPLSVSVDIEAPGKFTLAKGFGFDAPKVKVHATAQIVGQPNICVLGLNRSANGTISLEKNALVTGQSCAVFSNSTHTNSIKAKNSATLTADIICSAGGKTGGPGNFNPEPMVDCPAFEDPLAGRPEPTVGACTFNAMHYVDSSQQLSPGVYCGGLTIRNIAKVDLNPGTYIIKDGPLVIEDSAEVTGVNVGFFFTGNNASMYFHTDTTISLTAPETGTMAGLLIFASKSVGSEVYRIESDNARNLLGTIYLPAGELRIDANKPIADQSAYTAIVADSMRLYGGPHLILNTDYHLTTVPVPGGIKGVGQPIRLTQ